MLRESRGDTLKVSKGGASNGLAILPAASSFDNLSFTLVGLSMAIFRFGDRTARIEPNYRIEKPRGEPWIRWSEVTLL